MVKQCEGGGVGGKRSRWKPPRRQDQNKNANGHCPPQLRKWQPFMCYRGGRLSGQGTHGEKQKGTQGVGTSARVVYCRIQSTRLCRRISRCCRLVLASGSAGSHQNVSHCKDSSTNSSCTAAPAFSPQPFFTKRQNAFAWPAVSSLGRVPGVVQHKSHIDFRKPTWLSQHSLWCAPKFPTGGQSQQALRGGGVQWSPIS